MPRIEVNFIGLLLREVLIDKTIYVNVDGVEESLIVKELNYYHDLNEIVVCDKTDITDPTAKKYKLSVKDPFDIEYTEEIKKIVSEKKVKGNKQ